jgi:hypothetical protein
MPEGNVSTTMPAEMIALLLATVERVRWAIPEYL